MNRREFLSATGAGMAGILAGSYEQPLAAAELADRLPIIDTHTHFYDPFRPQGVPWPDKNDPVLYRRVMPVDFLKVAQPCGIQKTIVVEASAWLADNQWILDLAEKNKCLLGLVGNIVPGTPDFSQQIKHYAQNKLFRGIRVGSGTLVKNLDQEPFIQDLKTVADLDLQIDVLVDAQTLASAVTLAQKIPALRIVIDHVANLRIDGKAPPVLWTKNMQAAAGHRQVYCKVSGLVEGSGRTDGTAPADTTFYQPVLDHLWQVFGEDRLVFGSNWPVSERFASYTTVFNIVKNYFHAKGRTAEEKYFWKNAATAYRFADR